MTPASPEAAQRDPEASSEYIRVISDRSDDYLKSVFIPLHIAIENVHSQFFEYVRD